MPSANDNLAGAIALSGASGSTSVDATGNTTESGETSWIAATNRTLQSAWWSWVCPAAGEYEWRLVTAKPGYAWLTMFTGVAAGGYANSPFSSLSFRVGGLELSPVGARVRFTFVANTNYTFAAGVQTQGSAGLYTLSWAAPAVAAHGEARLIKGRATAALDDANEA